MRKALEPKEFVQNEKSKQFAEQVKTLKESGEIKSFAMISDELGWNPTMLSNVIHGRQNVPDDKYAMFSKLYPNVTTSDPDKLTLHGTLRIEALCTVILSTVAEILANQRGVPVAKIISELLKAVNTQLKEMTEK